MLLRAVFPDQSAAAPKLLYVSCGQVAECKDQKCEKLLIIATHIGLKLCLKNFIV